MRNSLGRVQITSHQVASPDLRWREVGSSAVVDQDQLGPWAGPAVVGYGYLGLIPFWAPVAATVFFPAWGARACGLQAIYGGLILSFLGGARFGRVLDQPGGGRQISQAMVPSVFALAVLALPPGWVGVKPMLLAAGLALACYWDLRAADLRAFYKVVRVRLTVMAGLALVLESVLMWIHV
jgi:hypothetical protein